MTIHRMDNVLIVVDDLYAVISFFVELGMELEGKGPIEGRWVERVIGIDEVRQDVAMLRTPDGHGRIELAMFHTPKAIRPEPKDATSEHAGHSPHHVRRRRHRGRCCTTAHPQRRTRRRGWRSTKTSTASATSAAQRASSSDWPKSSAERSWRRAQAAPTSLEA